jgi:hypothetical protein
MYERLRMTFDRQDRIAFMQLNDANVQRRATHANLREWYFDGQEPGQFASTCRGIFAKSQRPGIFALPHYSAQRSFIARDQPLAAAIPATHDMSCKFSVIGTQPTSGRARFLLDFRHFNKGGTCRGPYLETECARCVRRVRFRRRDLAGGILSSRGRRRRQTNN